MNWVVNIVTIHGVVQIYVSFLCKTIKKLLCLACFQKNLKKPKFALMSLTMKASCKASKSLIFRRVSKFWSNPLFSDLKKACGKYVYVQWKIILIGCFTDADEANILILHWEVSWHISSSHDDPDWSQERHLDSSWCQSGTTQWKSIHEPTRSIWLSVYRAKMTWNTHQMGSY